MKVSKWLKAGRSSKKMHTAIININCNKAGSVGDCCWGDYVQLSIYSKKKGRFMRLEMSLLEARRFQKRFNEGIKKFEN